MNGLITDAWRRGLAVFPEFFSHIHSRKVSERAIRSVTTLGLGLLTIVLAVLLAFSGLLLMLYYVPTTAEAYGSMQDIEYAVAFGSVVRALHRWTAHAMVVTVALHLIRIIAMSAYRRRAANWILGIALLLVTLGLAFTGYLLPWDQLSYWAVSVATSMLDHVPLFGMPVKSAILGGDIVGQPTLTRFYTLHVVLLPWLLFGLIALHIWRVRKDGGLAISSDRLLPANVPAWPHLILREIILAIMATAIFLLASHLIPAPLGSPPDFQVPSNPEKAPWYFLWIQETVSYSAYVGGFVFPLFALVLLICLPFLDKEDSGTGEWLPGKSQKAVLFSVVGSTLAFILFESIYLSVGVGSSAKLLWRDLLNPATGMLIVSLAAFWLGRYFTRSMKVALFSALSSIIVSVVGYTIIGLCRGPNWIFYWPWERWAIVN